MATNGLLTILNQFNQTQFKIVTGCDGYEIERLGRDLLKEDSKQFEPRFLKDFATRYVGCGECLFVISKDAIYPEPPACEALSLYRPTFDCPHFNPRWGYGSAAHTWLMRHDMQKIMPWIDPARSLFNADAFGVRGNTLRPVSGITFDLASPSKGMLNIADIAHALARICRFGGHIDAEWYSVAEHSVNCWKRSVEHGADIEAQMAVLMHDATEGYISDVIKRHKILMPYYSWIEERIEAIISQKWCIDFEQHREMINRCDHEMLVAEKNTFITQPETFGFKGEELVETFRFEPAKLKPLDAAAEFLHVWTKLDRRRKNASRKPAIEA